VSLRPELDAGLARARTGLDRLCGQRDLLERRRGVLVSEVALAKARALARPDLESLLEELQRDEHDRKIGNYSSMLTAFAQEVLQDGPEVVLRLGIERGLPSLDVFEKRGDGAEGGIMDDASGSLTNVICCGLRIVATACSGMRQFMALDEPDCWTESKNAPAFYRVLHEMADRTGMQVVVITHQKLDGLPLDVNVIELTGTSRDPDGLKASRRPGARGWKNAEQPGLRHICLRSFQSFKDARLDLSPGLNIVVGANNIGKSRLLRALRAVFYGMAEDSVLRVKGRAAEVDVGMEGGRLLTWSRLPKRNPVTQWRLSGADGQVVKTPDDRECDGGGKLPAWVGQMTGIHQAEDLDIQLAHQKKPLFLIEEKASDRARVLSMDGDSGLLRNMITLSKEARTADSASVRRGEAELARVHAQLAALKDIPQLSAAMDEADAMAEAVAAGERALEKVSADIQSAETAQTALRQAMAIADATRDLPEEELDLSGELARIREAELLGKATRDTADRLAQARRLVEATKELPDEEPSIVPTEVAETLVALSLRVSLDLAHSHAVIEATAGLPAQEPAFTPTDAAEMAAEVAEGLERRLLEIGAEADEALREELEIGTAMSDALAGLGSLCPLCGTPGIGHEHVLRTKVA
jgi:hypothetical protein